MCQYKALSIHHTPSKHGWTGICVLSVGCLSGITGIFWHMPLVRDIPAYKRDVKSVPAHAKVKNTHTHTHKAKAKTKTKTNSKNQNKTKNKNKENHRAQILASASDAVWPQLIWSKSPVITGEGGTGFLLIGKFCKWHHWSKLTVVRILAKWGNWLGKSSDVGFWFRGVFFGFK